MLFDGFIHNTQHQIVFGKNENITRVGLFGANNFIIFASLELRKSFVYEDAESDGIWYPNKNI